MTLEFLSNEFNAFVKSRNKYFQGLFQVFSLLFAVPHLGYFPEAKVLWAGTEPSEPLDNLVKQVRHNLADAGIPFDPKKYTPQDIYKRLLKLAQDDYKRRQRSKEER